MKNFKKICIFILTIFSFSTYAQSIDQKFLDSLPPEIAKDVIERAQSKADAESAYYRNPSTFISKPASNSERFGARVFSLMQTTLMPINEPNFDDSYVLDFGDQLRIQLTGQKSSISDLTIRRDGSINISEIGKIYLSGLSLNEASKMIKNLIDQAFIGVDTFVSLVNVRDIQIILAGNVYNPGSYTLSGNSNIFHALVVSGGPSEAGSFRSIELIRNNETIETIDLYDTFISGSSSFKSRLKSGDVVFVNPVSNVVSIRGGVKRPGQYELLLGENLFHLINFSNGLNAYADKSGISLDRIKGSTIETISIEDISKLKEINSKDGDRIFIRQHKFRLVKINGAVENPGTYLMTEGDKIKDIVEKSGGYTSNAYPFGGVYESVVAQGVNKKALDTLYNTYLDKIFEMQSSSYEFDAQSYVSIASELRNLQPNGRIIVDFSPNSMSDIYLGDGDIITIPETSSQVYVYGEVFSEGAVEYLENKNLDYYLSRSGGKNKSADIKNIYVLQPNGEAFRYKENRNIFQTQINKTKIYPGSIIFVPQKIDNKAARRLAAQSYAAILGNLGISLASLSVLKEQ